MSKADYVRAQPHTLGHTCHWPGCTREAPPAMWGCSQHWYRLPAALRTKICRAYRPSQEITEDPSTARAKDVGALQTCADPRGPENNTHLEAIMRAAPVVIAAWGPTSKLPPHLRKRWKTVAAMATKLGVTLHCLGTAKDGQPLHPLMLAANTPLAPWTPPA